MFLRGRTGRLRYFYVSGVTHKRFKWTGGRGSPADLITLVSGDPVPIPSVQQWYQ